MEKKNNDRNSSYFLPICGICLMTQPNKRPATRVGLCGRRRHGHVNQQPAGVRVQFGHIDFSCALAFPVIFLFIDFIRRFKSMPNITRIEWHIAVFDQLNSKNNAAFLFSYLLAPCLSFSRSISKSTIDEGRLMLTRATKVSSAISGECQYLLHSAAHINDCFCAVDVRHVFL